MALKNIARSHFLLRTNQNQLSSGGSEVQMNFVKNPRQDDQKLVTNDEMQWANLKVLNPFLFCGLDYWNLFAQGKRIDNKVSSARFQIPAGWIYRLYENKDYEGKFIDFVGNGQIEFVEDFQDFDFDDNVSSSRFRKPN